MEFRILQMSLDLLILYKCGRALGVFHVDSAKNLSGRGEFLFYTPVGFSWLFSPLNLVRL